MRQVAQSLGNPSNLRALIMELAPIIEAHGYVLNSFIGGLFDMEVIATANLPTAGASQDGRILIEDAGGGNRNLVFYTGGSRFRISATSF